MNTFDVISPVDNQMIGRISLTSKEQIVSALSCMSGGNDSIDRSEVLAFLNRLNKAIKYRKEEFFKRTWMETGFIAKDSMEMVDSAIEFLDHFEHFTGEFIQDDKEFHFSYDLTNKRRMKITGDLSGALPVLFLKMLPFH
ncbi:MAG: aldehyde dehydrogenase family protein [Nitrospira sp.]|nr:aldehyde dehydrogenase family protein [Nitrospira sp.]